MDKVKILVVEDELLVAEDIRMHLESFGYEVTFLATSYNEALNSIMSDLPDLVMVDINIDGEKDGIELGSFLRNEAEIPFIYLTANSDKLTVNRAKKTNPNAYLVKPFQPQNLFASVEMALSNAGKVSNNDLDNDDIDVGEELKIKDSFFLKRDKHYVKVKINEILYIHADGNYLNIYKSISEKFIIRSSIKNIVKHLPKESFFSPHKSYIINLREIEEVTPSSILIDGAEIPLSKNRKDDLFAMMNTF